MKIGVLYYIKLTNQLSFKTNFQNMDQYTGGRWLIHGTNTASSINYILAWNSPVEYPSWKYKFDIKESDSPMFNPIFWKRSRGGNIPGGERLQNQN